MDLDAYAAEHGAQWRRLAELSRRRRLSATEADELIALYQRVATHLSVVRSRSPDPVLVARLSQLVLTARARLAAEPGFSWSAVARFFGSRLPGAIYRAWPWWTGVAVGFTLVAGFLAWWVAGHPDSAAALLGEPPDGTLYEARFVDYYSEHEASAFAFHLWTNNAWVAARCLAAGILILPVFYLLWNTALTLGVHGGVLASFDRTEVFFGMILPHGLLELTGLFVAAGVGLRIGWAWIAPPPDLTRGQAVARAARTGILVAVGLFAVAGLIEAFVTPAVLPTAVRVGIGVLAWLGFLGYVIVLGRRAVAAEAVAEALAEADGAVPVSAGPPT